MRQLRVKAYSRREPAGYGYVGYMRVHYQVLQQKRWWGWQTIDREIVPSWAVIERCCLGSCDWPSKFSAHGTFGRDGIITPHDTQVLT